MLPKHHQVRRPCLGVLQKVLLRLLELREGIKHNRDLKARISTARGPLVQFLELFDHFLLAIRGLHTAMSQKRLCSHSHIILKATTMVMHKGNTWRYW